VSWDESRGAYVAHFGDGLSPSVTVAEVITEVVDTDGRPLFEYVDPDALDDLLDDAPGSTQVTFAVEDAVVCVRGDGRILVRSGAES
jgi:hypothetical protein